MTESEDREEYLCGLIGEMQEAVREAGLEREETRSLKRKSHARSKRVSSELKGTAVCQKCGCQRYNDPMSVQPFLHTLLIGQPKTITDPRGTWTSSILRDPVSEPVPLTQDGLAGDRVAQPYHGGPDGAVCVHLLDHYRFWNAGYAMNLEPGHVGENFTLDGLTEDDVCAGDIVRVGTALVQVSSPRVPCANLARRIGRPDWIRLTIRENRTGFYLRVLNEGQVQAGDLWELVERLNPDGTIPALNRWLYLEFDPAAVEKVAAMRGLSEWWIEQMVERAQKAAGHWSSTMKE